MLKLHHAPEKHRAYHGFAAIEWSDTLRSWCVFDPALIAEILKSANFVIPDYFAGYAKLEQRSGEGWNVLINTLRHIPFANEGDRHAKLRRDFAQLIQARSPAAKAAVRCQLEQLVPSVFREGGSAELIGALVRPLNDALFAELIGAPIPGPAPDGMSPSQVFDRFLGLNRLVRVRDEIARLWNAFALAGPTIPTDYATAFMAVGYDSVLGSVGSSLVALLQEGEGLPLCDLEYPEALPRTGVPYIERVATADCAMQGYKFAQGDRCRLFLDASPARGQLGDDAPFFGKGRHVCLGRELSQWLWQSLTQEMGKMSGKVRLVEAQLRRHDFVFSVYERIEVTIHG